MTETRVSPTMPDPHGPAPDVRPTARPYWPAWTSVTLLGAGLVVVLAETESLLILLGILFLGLGAYGLARRRSSVAASVAPSRPPDGEGARS